ncbi:MAG: carbamoyl-phosphate synthase large subunit [Candidatus Eutrophobiaceae bacterium]
MPKRNDIESILILGAGPIVIGQACEFDYSGIQACRALREEGYRIILVNSNPATIMTDPEMADATYVEPLDWRTVREVIKREKPHALLPTMGGQTALNCALDLAREGVFTEYGLELIGASAEAITKAENRESFREAMEKIGLKMPLAITVKSMSHARIVQERIGFPTVIRPSFTLGGTGGGVVWNRDEFEELCRQALRISPIHQVSLEQSVAGWKEYEMEVVRDCADNCIIVCSIENMDPMGTHTGDSITVAPVQTLTDKEFQIMRDAAIAVLREIGVDTGGSNVQFAINPENGEMHVIEMNPRVSRSSALASKATGFPIAKIAAKLAVGYTLDELRNEITGSATPASFEPTLDYVVTKIPRFAFEKFPEVEDQLGMQMHSVGEVMALGRTFQESLQKALRGLETGLVGLDEIVFDADIEAAEQASPEIIERIRYSLHTSNSERVRYIADAMRIGIDLEEIQSLTGIDPWFLQQIADLVETEQALRGKSLSDLDVNALRRLKRKGFSDARLAMLLLGEGGEDEVRAHRYGMGIRPVFKRVDSCAGEFATSTAYLYSSYEEECEAEPSEREKIMILGSGPNRIGQGIEFDYCCVYASFALRELGYETIMVNCNPETVSTDYDVSDRLYFEPLTLEDILEICSVEKPIGVVVQYGGQTPLKLAKRLEAAGVNIIGTQPDAIDLAEDRDRFRQLLDSLGLKQPPNAVAKSKAEAMELATGLQWPLLVRPSYVLGGNAMEIVHDAEELERWIDKAVAVSNQAPVLLDQFLPSAIEVDVDAICDGECVVIAGVMQHIEQAGVHSGDSACCLPPFDLDEKIILELAKQMSLMGKRLKVVGLMNAQFAIQGNDVYVLEVNPRASRTVPFVSKATGVAIAKVGAKCMAGVSLVAQGIKSIPVPPYFSVKESVFPFAKFSGSDPLLGPEMKSTGEVMGIGWSFGEAFAKGQAGTGQALPSQGSAFISVRDVDKGAILELAHELDALGFKIWATHGTANYLCGQGIECFGINKVREGRPHIVDKLKNGEISLIINTTEGKKAILDSASIRKQALISQVCYTTTLAGAQATLEALKQSQRQSVHSLQELHARISS